MPTNDGGLGSHLVGDKITISQRNFTITKLLGEGGFSYVYLVKEHSDGPNQDDKRGASADGIGRQGAGAEKNLLVLKVTSIHSRAQRDIAEKEAKLLSRLSHPSIVKMYDTCYQSIAHVGGVLTKRGKDSSSGAGGSSGNKERPQHLILMEFCEGGHALDVCNKLASAGQRFDLSTLIIAFGQICNAVSYLHAQRPPIVHRDLKPVNFLVKNGAYKLCDFGSAVFGHVDLKTPRARAEAEEVVQKTTTQMFRAPEMVDLFMAKKLTQATDVWALGCCLYSLAYLQNCFEEGSNLAILSRKFTIPEDNPYGDGLVELLDRMLTVDSKARADMTEVILCLSAVYSGRPLPPRKRKSKPSEKKGSEGNGAGEESKEKKSERVGTYRLDGQGVQGIVYDPTKVTEAKKLASNSVAARRKRAATAAAKTPAAVSSSVSPPASGTTTPDPIEFTSFNGKFDDGAGGTGDAKNLAFPSGENPFGDIKGFEVEGDVNTDDFFGSFEDSNEQHTSNANDAFEAAFDTAAWGSENGGSSDQGEESEIPSPAQMPDSMPTSAFVEEGVEIGPVSNEERKRQDGGSTEQQRKERARRRRAPGAPKPGRTGAEASMENMNLEPSSSAEAKGPMDPSGLPPKSTSPEKRDGRPRRSKTDDDSSRKRSSSWARRRGRGLRGSDKSDTEGASEGKSPSRGTSIRNLFGRGSGKSSDGSS